MQTYWSRSGIAWIVWYVVALHFIWAFLLVFFPESGYATPTAGFLHLLPANPPLSAPLLLVASPVAVGIGMQAVQQGTWLGVSMLLLQQIALLLTAMTSANAVLSQQYADGVPRPWPFIFADQLPALLTFVFHGFAVIDHHWHRPQRLQEYRV